MEHGYHRFNGFSSVHFNFMRIHIQQMAPFNRVVSDYTASQQVKSILSFQSVSSVFLLYLYPHESDLGRVALHSLNNSRNSLPATYTSGHHPVLFI